MVDQPAPVTAVEQEDPNIMRHHAPAVASTATPTKRDKLFDDEMDKFNQNFVSELNDQKLSAEQFFDKIRQDEKEEAERLRKMLQEDKDLTENQKKEAKAFIKGDDYDTHCEDIFKNRDKDPAAYAKLQKDFQDYQQLYYDSPEFKDDAHIKKLHELEDKFHDPKTTDAQKAALGHQIKEEFRAFEQEQAADPNGTDKYITFMERNKDNTVIKESGMYDMAESLRAKLHEQGHEVLQPQAAVQAAPAAKRDLINQQGFELIANSPEFKDDTYIKKIHELEDKINDPKTPAAEKANLQQQVKEDLGAFQKEQAADPQVADKFISFVERNKDNAVIKESGMYEVAEALKEKKQANEAIGSNPVTPAGAQAGAVADVKYTAENGIEITKNQDGKLVATDKDHHEVKAGTEVAVTVDDGKGGKTTEKYQVAEHGIMNPVQPAAGPSTGAPAQVQQK